MPQQSSSVVEFTGLSESLAAFSQGEMTAIVSTATHTVLSECPRAMLPGDISQPHPEQVPYSAYAAALSHFDCTSLTSRGYQIPRAVRSAAQRALQWSDSRGTPLPAAAHEFAQMLQHGGQLQQSHVQHMYAALESLAAAPRESSFFPGSPGYPSDQRLAWEAWGSDDGLTWAKKILRGVTAAAPPSIDVDVDDDEEIIFYPEDEYADDHDLTDEELLAWRDDAPHEFLAGLDPRLCAVCGRDAGTLLHADVTTRTTDGLLAALDPFSTSDFFDNGEELFFFDHTADDDLVHEIYMSGDGGNTLFQWDPKESEWIVASDLPDSALPIDPESAYLAAQYQSDPAYEGTSVHPSAISQEEWELCDRALPAVIAEVDSLSSDNAPKFFAVLSDDGDPTDLGLSTPEAYWRWYPEDGEWRMQSAQFAQSNTALLSEEDARALAEKLAQISLDKDMDRRDGFRHAYVLNSQHVSAPTRHDPLIDDDVLFDDSDQTSLTADAVADYTPEERSRNASQQVRDRMGRFARAQSRVAVNGKEGVISRVYPEARAVTVKMDDGQTINVSAKDVEVIKSAPPQTTPKNTPKARLSTRRPALTAGQLSDIIAAYEKTVADARAKSVESLAFSPETSDVPPIYLAIVDSADTSAVLDLVALAPSAQTGIATTAYVRKDGDWIKDDMVYRQLKSTTPPTVVALTSEDMEQVKSQIDIFYAEKEADSDNRNKNTSDSALVSGATALWDEYGTLTAAGGLDRNRGNAENLRRYWTVGPGAAKIKWGLPGSWKRCVRHLSKYLGVRAKGYCNLRYKEVLGIYPGERNKSFNALGVSPTLFIVPRETTVAAVAAAEAGDALDSSTVLAWLRETLGIAAPTEIFALDSQHSTICADTRPIPGSTSSIVNPRAFETITSSTTAFPQFGVIVSSITSSPSVPISKSSTPNVLRTGDWFEVGRFDTQRLTAEVVQVQSVRDITDPQSIRNSMGLLPGVKLAVSSPSPATCPDQTSSDLVTLNTTQESIFEGKLAQPSVITGRDTAIGMSSPLSVVPRAQTAGKDYIGAVTVSAGASHRGMVPRLFVLVQDDSFVETSLVSAALNNTDRVLLSLRTPSVYETSLARDIDFSINLLIGQKFPVRAAGLTYIAEVVDPTDYLGWTGQEVTLSVTDSGMLEVITDGIFDV